MSDSSEQKRLYISTPPEYEMKLLTALAAFLGRKVTAQASACLAMYLRQSHDRILSQCEYYGHRWGMNKWEVLDLCYSDPDKARELIDGIGTVHNLKEDGADVFSNEDEDE